MHILVTGFDPFGDESINPASMILEKLPAEIAGHKIKTLQIPTSAEGSAQALEEALESEDFDAVVSLGQAGGRADITLERVAINLDEFRIADNEGQIISGQKIAEDGPDGYLSSLPLKAMVSHIQNNKIPASISYSAGTFVCNHVFYLANFFMEKKGKARLATFIHVPFLPEQTAYKPQHPSMSLDMMVRAVVCALEVIDADDEVEVTAGTIC